jgi:hypothetical protein
LATAGAVDARTVAVVVAPRGASKIGRSVADRLNAKLFEEPVLEVRGFSRTEGVRLASGDIPANLLVVDVPGAPAHELLAQAGFPLEYRGPAGLGYAPVNGASGVARHRADGVNYLAIGGVLGLTEPRPDADVRTALRAIFTELIVDEEAEEHKAAEHRDHVEDTQK